MHKFLKMAYEFAKDHQFDPSLEYKLCAVIVRGGKVLSVGYNHRNTNSFTEHYKEKVRDHCCTTHAEVDAILQKRGKIRFNGSKIYVVRIRWDGTIGNSKPCLMCFHVLFNYGIKRVHFTTNEFPGVDSIKIANPALRP